MFFSISVKIAFAVNFVAMASNALLCLLCDDRIASEKLRPIIWQCRWIGVLYFVFAWFTVEENLLLESGRTMYEQISFDMLLVSVGWMIIFGIVLIANFFVSGDKMGNSALGMGTLYFVLAYLLH